MMTHPEKDFYDAFETFSVQIKHSDETTRSHLRENYN